MVSKSFILWQKREAAKKVFIDWLEGDGFQEGAHGASMIIDVVWGFGTADRWEAEWRMWKSNQPNPPH
jgi:hypothetical protein